jgi:hypothetical protein
VPAASVEHVLLPVLRVEGGTLLRLELLLVLLRVEGGALLLFGFGVVQGVSNEVPNHQPNRNFASIDYGSFFIGHFLTHWMNINMM